MLPRCFPSSRCGTNAAESCGCVVRCCCRCASDRTLGCSALNSCARSALNSRLHSSTSSVFCTVGISKVRVRNDACSRRYSPVPRDRTATRCARRTRAQQSRAARCRSAARAACRPCSLQCHQQCSQHNVLIRHHLPRAASCAKKESARAASDASVCSSCRASDGSTSSCLMRRCKASALNTRIAVSCTLRGCASLMLCTSAVSSGAVSRGYCTKRSP